MAVKVCLDPAVLVAALSTRGLCADVLRLVLARHRLVANHRVLADVRRLLVERLGVPAILADQVPPFLREHAELSNPPKPWPGVGFPQGWLLASAMHAKADLLVTHDPSLVAHGPEFPLTVLDPRGYWQRMRGDTAPA